MVYTGKSRCSKCRTVQKENWPSFYNRAVSATFPKPFFCKDCKRIQFLLDNPGVVEERNRKREINKKNKEKAREEANKFKEFFQTNEKARTWVEEVKEIRRESQRKYLATEKGRAVYRDSMAKRRAKVLNALIDISKEEKKKIREFYRDRPEGHHVDHIIPISKGGKHCIENLQYLCASDNAQKRNRIRISDLKKILNDAPISVTWLQSRLKLEYEKAKEVFEEIQQIVNQ